MKSGKNNDQPGSIHHHSQSSLLPATAHVYHIVKKGETLQGIAVHYNVSLSLVQRVNRISNPQLVYAGQKLIIPQQSIDSNQSSNPLSSSETINQTSSTTSTNNNNQNSNVKQSPPLEINKNSTSSTSSTTTSTTSSQQNKWSRSTDFSLLSSNIEVGENNNNNNSNNNNVLNTSSNSSSKHGSGNILPSSSSSSSLSSSASSSISDILNRPIVDNLSNSSNFLRSSFEKDLIHFGKEEEKTSAHHQHPNSLHGSKSVDSITIPHTHVISDHSDPLSHSPLSTSPTSKSILTDSHPVVFRKPATYVTLKEMIGGVLTVTSQMLFFEPNLQQSAVERYGALACQVYIQLSDLSHCHLIEDTSLYPFIRQGTTKCLCVSGKLHPTQVQHKVIYFLLQKDAADSVFNSLDDWMSQQPNRNSQLEDHDHTFDHPAIQHAGGGGNSHVSIPSTAPFVNFPKLRGESKILKEKYLTKLVWALPERCTRVDWVLLYSTAQHGISFNTFFNKVRDCAPSILLIQDTQHHVFGAFMTEPWKPNNPRYYGGGESFVFQLEPHMKIYKWTRKNNHFMLTDTGSIAVGGGGNFAIWLDSDLFHGSSRASDTFNNPCLSNAEQFECLYFEVWGFEGHLHNYTK